MGLETAALVMAGVAVAAEVGKGVSETKAAGARKQALDLEGKQIELQTQQRTLQNYDVMEKVLDAQEAHMTTTGAAFSSPSYNAIQRNTLNISSKQQKNINIENAFQEESRKTEKENVRNSLYAQLFGDAAATATSVAGIYNKAPRAS